MNEFDHRMIIQEFFYVFGMWIGTTEFDHGILALLTQQRQRPENSGLNGDSNPTIVHFQGSQVHLACQLQIIATRNHL